MKRKKVTCVIPALNEEDTIQSVIEAVQKVKEVDEVLVVDDGSTDNTAKIAKKCGANVYSHRKNRGKGSAMKTGAEESKNDYLVYVDADLQNLSVQKVRKLIKPLLDGEADFVKGSYQYAMGRVTKLVVRPLLKIIYPFIDLEHPLSGEIALNKRKFRFDNLEKGWGVDIQLVLQAAKKRLRIKEVKLGKKEHKHQDLDSLSDMSEQIIKTVLTDLKFIAHKYKIVFFDLDKTLIKNSSIQVIGREWGFLEEFKQLQQDVDDGKIDDKEITRTLAKHFKSKTQEDVDQICEKMEVNPFAAQVITQLRKQRFRVRIVSAAYSPVVQYFCDKLEIHDFVCPRLEVDKDGFFTGKLRKSRFEDKDGSCCGLEVCKRKAVDHVRNRFGFSAEECMCVGDGKSDKCMFATCGLALGYQTDIADIEIQNFSEVLMYVD